MSTLYVDNLQPNLGSYVHSDGHVVNYKIYDWTSYTVSTSTSFTLMRSATYSPKKAGNLVIIEPYGRVSVDPYAGVISLADFGISIDGGATFIGGHEFGNATSSYPHNDRSGSRQFMGYFTAADTSPVTIGIYMRDHLGVDAYSNGSYFGGGFRDNHGFTVMEIAQ